MVKDSKIPLIEAMVVVKELCEVSTGKEHEMVRVPVEIPANGIRIGTHTAGIPQLLPVINANPETTVKDIAGNNFALTKGITCVTT